MIKLYSVVESSAKKVTISPNSGKLIIENLDISHDEKFTQAIETFNKKLTLEKLLSKNDGFLQESYKEDAEYNHVYRTLLTDENYNGFSVPFLYWYVMRSNDELTVEKLNNDLLDFVTGIENIEDKVNEEEVRLVVMKVK